MNGTAGQKNFLSPDEKKNLVRRLAQGNALVKEENGPADFSEIQAFLESPEEESDRFLYSAADQTRQRIYGREVYIRGLIEFTNICKNNCLYCGIRAGNTKVSRYRLTKEQILSCCETGWNLGFRTFVLQGGEDPHFTDDVLCRIVLQIKLRWPQAAVTLSVGERSRDSYRRLFEAGADRYLLRHETANPGHYAKLHPPEMQWERRMQCLRDLREIGFQVGAGCMVGSPWQTKADLTEDLRFFHTFQPDMIGIGPFLPHYDTPLGKRWHAGSLRDTLVMVAMTRLLLPQSLIPSTTALGTLSPKGRILGLKSGANVVMPNLSPAEQRANYSLYDHKVFSGAEAAEGLRILEEQTKEAGYHIAYARGDRYGFTQRILSEE